MRFVIDEGATMMGQTASQDQLFHAFNLTDHAFHAVTCYVGLVACLISENCVNTWHLSIAT